MQARVGPRRSTPRPGSHCGGKRGSACFALPARIAEAREEGSGDEPRKASTKPTFDGPRASAGLSDDSEEWGKVRVYLPDSLNGSISFSIQLVFFFLYL